MPLPTWEFSIRTSPTVETLLAEVRDTNPNIRTRAVRALAHQGKPAVDTLINALADKHEPVRRMTAWALGRMGQDAHPAVPTLIQALHDEEKDVRRTAAEALGKIGEPAKAIVPALMETFNNDKEAEVQKAAARALAKMFGMSDTMKQIYQKKRNAPATLFAGVLLAFGGLHLLLFVFYPKLSGNLYYAILVSCFAVVKFVMESDSDTSTLFPKRLRLPTPGITSIRC